MKPISIIMRCPIYLQDYKVYCYQLPDNFILPNGCNQFHFCKECEDCCNRSIEICKGKLSLQPSELDLHKT